MKSPREWAHEMLYSECGEWGADDEHSEECDDATHLIQAAVDDERKRCVALTAERERLAEANGPEHFAVLLAGLKRAIETPPSDATKGRGT